MKEKISSEQPAAWLQGTQILTSASPIRRPPRAGAPDVPSVGIFLSLPDFALSRRSSSAAGGRDLILDFSFHISLRLQASENLFPFIPGFQKSRQPTVSFAVRCRGGLAARDAGSPDGPPKGVPSPQEQLRASEVRPRKSAPQSAAPFRGGFPIGRGLLAASADAKKGRGRRLFVRCGQAGRGPVAAVARPDSPQAVCGGG